MKIISTRDHAALDWRPFHWRGGPEEDDQAPEVVLDDHDPLRTDVYDEHERAAALVAQRGRLVDRIVRVAEGADWHECCICLRRLRMPPDGVYVSVATGAEASSTVCVSCAVANGWRGPLPGAGGVSL